MKRDRISPSVRRFSIEGGLLLFDGKSDSLFAYNATALDIWKMIERGCGLGQMQGAIARKWGIEEARARVDVEAIIAEWRARNLFADDLGLGSSEPSTASAVGETRAPAAWTLEWVCTVRGMTLSFAADTEVAHPIRALLGHLITTDAKPAHRIEITRAPWGLYTVTLDGVERLNTVDPAQVVGGTWQIILQAIDPELRWLGVIHGAVVTRGNTGLALAAPSGSGKSTLVAGLLRRGFAYAADDIVALSAPTGAAVPWPLPLSIKPGSLEVLAPLYPALAEAPSYRTRGLDARLLVPPPIVWETGPIDIGQIVFPRYQRGASTALRRLTAFESLQRLLADRVWLGHPITEAGLAAFLDWLARTPTHALTYGSLDDAVQSIGTLMP